MKEGLNYRCNIRYRSGDRDHKLAQKGCNIAIDYSKDSKAAPDTPINQAWIDEDRKKGNVYDGLRRSGKSHPNRACWFL